MNIVDLAPYFLWTTQHVSMEEQYTQKTALSLFKGVITSVATQHSILEEEFTLITAPWCSAGTLFSVQTQDDRKVEGCMD